ncbi:MAG TPA: hypothetical protein P5181_02300 [Dermatophilaceae bacterium]|nr:hypothetical protein [Dermatophilaceae bacterium]
MTRGRTMLVQGSEVPVPDGSRAQPLVAAPGRGIGNWTGAPSAASDGAGGYWLAYRVRRPVTEGRGVAVELAHWRPGGESEVVARVSRELVGAESLERPSLVQRSDGAWRLYLSCATWESKHWWIEALDADTVAELPTGSRTVVLPGSDDLAVKDPVVCRDTAGWRAWICCHLLDVPGEEDRMTTASTSSPDGLTWAPLVTVLRPDGDGWGGTGWDSRARRVTAVLPTPHAFVAYYDGRASAAENWYERTGIAWAATESGQTQQPFEVLPGPVAQSPVGTHALRYLTVLPEGNGWRLFYECARPDGAHDLVTELVTGLPPTEE